MYNMEMSHTIPPIHAHECKLLYSIHENESIYHYDNDIVVEFLSAESFHLELPIQ